MLKMLNNSDVAVIVLHEIYGINGHIIGVCRQISKSGYDVICPNMLKLKQPFDYSQEDQAYSYFKEYIGFDVVSKQVREIIVQVRAKYKKRYIYWDLAWGQRQLGYAVGMMLQSTE